MPEAFAAEKHCFPFNLEDCGEDMVGLELRIVRVVVEDAVCRTLCRVMIDGGGNLRLIIKTPHTSGTSRHIQVPSRHGLHHTRPGWPDRNLDELLALALWPIDPATNVCQACAPLHPLQCCPLSSSSTSPLLQLCAEEGAAAGFSSAAASNSANMAQKRGVHNTLASMALPQIPVFPLPPLPPITDPILSRTALTHPSQHQGHRRPFDLEGTDRPEDYEKLEHVGDALLGSVVTLLLHDLYPDLDPGAATVSAASSSGSHMGCQARADGRNSSHFSFRTRRWRSSAFAISSTTTSLVRLRRCQRSVRRWVHVRAFSKRTSRLCTMIS